MKKLFAVILVLCMIPVFAMACEEELPAFPMIETTSGSYSGYAYFALDESRHICAKVGVDEAVKICSSTYDESACIRGIVGNGIIRAKNELRYLNICGHLCGLTKVKCSVFIKEEYKEIVQSIIGRRIENNNELNTNTVIACTQWRTPETIYHIMFTSNVSHVSVGTLTVNECTTDICIGDFNGDGLFELGFPAGSWIEETKPEPVEEPEPLPEPTVIINNHYYVSEKTETKVCTKIIQDNRQINVNSVVQNNQKQIVNMCSPKNVCQKPVCIK